MKKRFNSKEKGNKFELKVAKALNEEYKWLISNVEHGEFKRVPLSGGFDPVMFPGDIMTPSEEVKVNFPFVIECKHHEDWSITDAISTRSKLFDWFAQAAVDCQLSIYRDTHNPLVIFKRNRNETLVMSYDNIISGFSATSLAINNVDAVKLAIEKRIASKSSSHNREEIENASHTIITRKLLISNIGIISICNFNQFIAAHSLSVQLALGYGESE